MSIKGILDTYVHIHSFRNLDLFEQGVYMLRITLEDSEASPYISHVCDPASKICPEHHLAESRVHDFSFYSQGFSIRYAEE